MFRIAHRRRGSESGHHPFAFALVTPPLLPLALSTSSHRWSLALSFFLRFRPTCAFDPSETSTGTDGDTTVSSHRLLSSFLHPASASMLTTGPLLCL